MSSSSKTEQPTQKRLQDAAKKGQSFKSKDLIVAILSLIGVLFLINGVSLTEFMVVFRHIIEQNFNDNLSAYGMQLMWLGAKTMLPLLGVCILASTLPALLQTKFVLATEALGIKFESLSPANGFKKLFNLRVLKDSVKCVLYLISFVVAVCITWENKKQLLFTQLNGTVTDMVAIWIELLTTIILTCLVSCILIMVLDMLAEYFLHIKDQKMDKQEVKQEYKMQQGSPELKSKRKELVNEFLSEQMKSDIEKSDMIIVNPTHLAIGIYYRPDLVPIPFISLLERNQRALAVRQYAEKVGVPVIENIALARRIYKTHKRYTFVSMQEVMYVMQLIVWIRQVEQAGQDEEEAMQLIEQNELDIQKNANNVEQKGIE
ncbi:EscU/YscU/HrcU family type III secretion system export apparatus switch protein [Chromobacterium piscinae]|uniref:EscU/YscU/HrcU family type III secretion system export apparatus switch protein n=1 Tax=Chromobacterium piscinae TaxID=686831 RepID=A0ABV0HBT7_9NEIS